MLMARHSGHSGLARYRRHHAVLESAPDKPGVYGICGYCPGYCCKGRYSPKHESLRVVPSWYLHPHYCHDRDHSHHDKIHRDGFREKGLFYRREIAAPHHGFHKQRLKYEESHHESREVLDYEVEAVRKAQMKCDNSAEYETCRISCH